MPEPRDILLDFLVQNEDNRQMHQQSGWTATPSRLIDAISAIPTIFMPDALPDTTLPFILAWDRHQICWLAYTVA